MTKWLYNPHTKSNGKSINFKDERIFHVINSCFIIYDKANKVHVPDKLPNICFLSGIESESVHNNAAIFAAKEGWLEPYFKNAPERDDDDSSDSSCGQSMPSCLQTEWVNPQSPMSHLQFKNLCKQLTLCQPLFMSFLPGCEKKYISYCPFAK